MAENQREFTRDPYPADDSSPTQLFGMILTDIDTGESIKVEAKRTGRMRSRQM
jgi:hypothetical protein